MNKQNGNTSSLVFNYLKDGIAEGKWAPGEKIPTEMQLCQKLGVSRVSARRAIGQLVSIGLLRSVQGSGTYVCEPEISQPFYAMLPSLYLNREDQLSMLEFRRILEIQTAGICAERATDKETTRLFYLTEKMEQSEKQAEIIRYDMEFHKQIALSTKNFAIIKVFEIVQEAYLQLLTHNVNSEGNYGVRHHRMIAEAVKNRDSKAAKQYMAEHLKHSEQLYNLE